MNGRKQSIFRRESLDRVNSPEQLNEYIRVANPSVWVALSAVLLLLLGAVLWSVFGSIDSTVPCVLQIQDGQAAAWLSRSDAAGVEPGMKLLCGDAEGRVEAVSTGADGTDFRVEVTLTGLPDGEYDAEIVTESIAPIRFVIH